MRKLQEKVPTFLDSVTASVYIALEQVFGAVTGKDQGATLLMCLTRPQNQLALGQVHRAVTGADHARCECRAADRALHLRAGAAHGRPGRRGCGRDQPADAAARGRHVDARPCAWPPHQQRLLTWLLTWPITRARFAAILAMVADVAGAC